LNENAAVAFSRDMSAERMTKDEKQSVAQPKRWHVYLWREWVKPMLTCLIVVCALRSAIADWNDVPTASMKPTIIEGDRVFVNKLAYDLKVPFTTVRLATWAEPKQGDVVVFFSPHDGTRLVKRVIGLPGDQIELRDNKLYVNGEAVSYGPLEAEVISQVAPQERPTHSYAKEKLRERTHAVMLTPQLPSQRSFGPILVPSGHYFVMGDNRDNSFDSRYYGPVKREKIVGRATLVVLSVDRDHYYRPRWDRFFSPLP
jgi:signal peptidase I